MNDMYHEQIIEEAREPQQYGELANADAVLHGTNASCGDELTIYLEFEKKGDRTSPIVQVGWVGQGCVISRASMSVLAGKIMSEKITLTQLLDWNETQLEQLLGLHEISIGRLKCLLLGLRTLQSDL